MAMAAPLSPRLSFFLVASLASLSLSFGEKQATKEVHVGVTTPLSRKAFVTGQKNPKSCASAYFAEGMSAVGWNFVHIISNGDCADLDQAYSAGFAEGYMTAPQIWNHWLNTKYEFEKLSDGVFDYFSQNRNYMDKMAILDHHDNDNDAAYWWQVRLVLEQVQGMEDGYHFAAKPGQSLPEGFAFLINSDGEIYDLEPAFPAKKPDDTNDDDTFAGTSHLLRGRNRNGAAKARTSDGSDDVFNKQTLYDKCSGLVKVLPDNSQIFIGQVAFTGLEEMYQMYKMYDFAFKTAKGASSTLPGRKTTFSSYPGHVFSGDDFYIMSSGLAAVETTIYCFNMDLYKKITPTGTVLEWIRNMVANRLATSAVDWSEIFGRYNSGTYNNQWLVLDYNLFTPGQPLKNNTLWILEQYPGAVEAWDMTETLREKGYVTSFNSPWNQRLRTLAGWDDAVKKFGSFYTPDKQPRARIAARDHVKVTDVDSFKKLLRYNDFRHDPLAVCKLCNPPYSGEFGIASRGDLNPANGTYPFPQVGHRDHASISAKATSNLLAKDMVSLAIAGPTCDYLPVFQWSKSDFNYLAHVGHPDIFNFPWVRVQFEGSLDQPSLDLQINSTLCSPHN